MASIGDSRFGQWANPRFGANLGRGQGVLPSGNANRSMSASSPQSNQMTYPRRTGPGPSEAPGAGFNSGIGHARSPQGFNSGVVQFADGGMIDDTDTGNAETGGTLDPMAFLGQEDKSLDQRLMGSGAPLSENVEDRRGAPRDILLALEFGRNLFNVGTVFKKGLKDADAAFKRQNESMFGKKPDESGAGGFDEAGFTDQPEEDMQFAEGGVIPEGDEEQAAPEQGGGQPSEQSAMAYLSGQGAVGPDVAQAMEQQVDPQGQMDPSERKMQAITRAGSPDKAFALMQHYRQKFMAYNSFAKAALQGAGGRPPNPAAAADALTKAYENVPDGQSMRFIPTRGGMQVQVRKHQQPQQFAVGGLVGGYDDTYESPSEDQALRDAPADPSDAIAQAEGEGPANLGRTIVLGWNSLMKMLEGPGLDYDKAVENPNSLGQDALPYHSPEEDQAARDAPAPGQEAQADPAAQNDELRDWPTQPPQKVAQAASRKPSLDDVLHEIDLAHPYIGQSTAKAEARALAIQNWHKNSGLEREELRQEAGNWRAGLGAATKQALENTKSANKIELAQQAQAAAMNRLMQSGYQKAEIQRMIEDGRMDRFVAHEIQSNFRAGLTATGSGAKAEEISKAHAQPTRPQVNPTTMQGGQAPQARMQGQQQPQSQPLQSSPLPPAAMSSLREGEHTKFRNGQVWTLQGGRPVQVQ